MIWCMTTNVREHVEITREQQRESEILHVGAHTVASGVGLGSIAGAVVGPEGVIVGAVIGALVGLVLSLRRPSSNGS